MEKILIATDAYHPQINGVVRTLDTTSKILQNNNISVEFITPLNFTNFPWPFYKEISLSIPKNKTIAAIYDTYKPDYVHISTEGPIGIWMRHFCLKNKIKFTTSYHTKFPEYLKKMHNLPLCMSYKYFKWFHSAAQKVFAPTNSVAQLLRSRGLKNVVVWSRGVDTVLFKPYPKTLSFNKPIIAYVGRVSVEKNIEAFLSIKTHGTKIVIGDGPILQDLISKHKDIVFFGARKGIELADLYSQADVFVFPSKSDTFGLVLLESLACGVPFAAYEEPGPLHIAASDFELTSKSCFINSDLQIAVDEALQNGCSTSARLLAELFSWENCTQRFIELIREANEI